MQTNTSQKIATNEVNEFDWVIDQINAIKFVVASEIIGLQDSISRVNLYYFLQYYFPLHV